MIDHIGIGASDFDASKRVYDAALAALDIASIMKVTAEQSGGYHGISYGKKSKPFFWLGDNGPRGTGVHIAFPASSRSQVDAFHAAALAAGGKDNGVPGLRPHYRPLYFAAFVIDPDGLNVEAVCHTPE